MKVFIDIKYVLRVAIEAWRFRRHLRKGGCPDLF